MKCFKFLNKKNYGYGYTLVGMKELTDNKTIFGSDGDPKKTSIPKFFQQYETVDEIVKAHNIPVASGSNKLKKINRYFVLAEKEYGGSHVSIFFTTKSQCPDRFILHMENAEKESKSLKSKA